MGEGCNASWLQGIL